MKIIGISTSPRKNRTTRTCLEAALQAARESQDNIATELIDLAQLKVGGCLACGKCLKELACSQEDDFNSLIPLLANGEVGGIIIATPVYFGSMSSQCKAFLDRCVSLRRNGFLLRDKVGGVIAVGGFRNGGQELAIQAVHTVMLVQDMIIVGDGKPHAHFGGAAWSNHPDGLEKDLIGLETVRNLGKRVAEVAIRLTLPKSG
jgi:multimeric flavodoxin WrbA